jgi:hypothetical protein
VEGLVSAGKMLTKNEARPKHKTPTEMSLQQQNNGAVVVEYLWRDQGATASWQTTAALASVSIDAELNPIFQVTCTAANAAGTVLQTHALYESNIACLATPSRLLLVSATSKFVLAVSTQHEPRLAKLCELLRRFVRVEHHAAAAAAAAEEEEEEEEAEGGGAEKSTASVGLQLLLAQPAAAAAQFGAAPPVDGKHEHDHAMANLRRLLKSARFQAYCASVHTALNRFRSTASAAERELVG